MMVQQQQRIALGVSLQAALHPLELVFAQFAVRYAEHLAVQHQHLPVIAQQHLFGRRNASGGQRVDHRRLKIVVTRQPHAGGRQLRDAGGEVAVRLLRMILRQISRGDDQVDIAALRTDGVQHRVIAAIGIDAEQRLVFAGKKVGICYL